MIELINIAASLKTPAVTLDPNGLIKIQGRSIPEDAAIFYKKIIDWIKAYCAIGIDTTRVDLRFEYLNSGTSKYVLQILKALKELPQGNHQLIVNWFYEDGDDDILERGEYYSSILDIKINFISE